MKYIAIKKAIAYILVFTMLLSCMPYTIFAATPSDFTDFPTGWSKEAVTAAVENGLLNGRSADKLEPAGYLTRAEMATIINRAFGATVTKDISHISDVKKGDWFYSEIEKAVNMQTFEGYEDGTMRPNNFITREEVFAVIARALVLETNDYSPLNKFIDASMVSEWAKPYAAILVAKQYINGDDLGKLNPIDNITREEFAQMMHNIVKTYCTEKTTYRTVGTDCTLIRTPGVILSDVVIDGDLILGDGVGKGDVTLINVTINGRLLTRGGEGNVTLTNTTVGEGVVVKDVNGIVHFNNYREEEPFKNLNEITPATFIPKQVVIPPSGGSIGGGGGSSTPSQIEYTVYHYIEDADGDITLNGVKYKVHKKTTKKVDKGTKITLSAENVYGYELDTASGDAFRLDTQIKLTSKTDFKLYYNLKKYTVNVSLPDGSVQNIEYKHGELFGSNFNMDAYPDVKFYYISADGETEVEITENLPITSPMDIRSKQIHTIRFDYNDASGRVIEVKVEHGGTTGLRTPVPERDGYTFAGWNTAFDGSGSVFSSEVAVNTSITVYALWNKEKYTISYQSQFGFVNSVVTEYDIETAVTLPVEADFESHDGYKFDGWYKEASFKTKVNSIEAGSKGNITLYARWLDISVTYHEVTFDFNYVASPAPVTVSIEEGQCVSEPASPERTGYTFGGWYAEAECNNAFDFSQPINAPVTIYAKWTVVTVGINYSLNGGSFKSGAYKPESYTVENLPLTLPTANDLEYEGYEFKGWYTDEALTMPISQITSLSASDINLYAKWQPKTYTVIIKTPGVADTTKIFVHGQKIKDVIPTAPVRPGYSFNGYNTIEDGSGISYSQDSVVTGELLLYTQWTIVKYNINYELNGGAMANAAAFVDKYTIEDSVTLPVASDFAPRAGYKFEGWYKTSDFAGGAITQIPAGTVNDINLFAKWSELKYSIAYELNGGTIKNSDKFVSEYTVTQKVTLPTANDFETRTGYKFDGWYSNSSFTGNKVTEISVGSTENKQFFAKWDKLTYSVNYNLNGGVKKNNAAFITSYTVTDSFTLPNASDIEKEGYDFKGWYTNSSLTGSAVTVVTVGTTGIINLYAKWEKKTYTVKFNVDGVVSEHTYEHGDKISSKMSDPSKNGYTFAGWYTGLNGTGTAYTKDSEVKGAYVLYAHWSANSYPVVYETNGGVAKPGVTFKSSYTIEETFALPTQNDFSEYEGYNFKGWYKNSSLTDGPVTSVTAGTTGALTFYAKWEKKTYTVTFVTDGASVNKTYTHGDKISSNMSNPSKSGYTFAGWYTGQNGTGTLYTKDSEVKGSYTLYAHWTVNNYTITYELGGATKKNESAFKTSYTVNDSFALPGEGDFNEYEGYEFKGWYKNADFTGGQVTNVALGTTGSFTLYAKWERKTYNVTFIVDGASSSKTYTHGEKISVNMSDPAKTGYTFAGWYTEQNGAGTKYTKDSAVTSANTLYAHWSAVNYTIEYKLNDGVQKPGAVFKTAYTIEETFALPTSDDFNPREGYEFKGWYKNADFTGGQVTNVSLGTTGNLTFWAKWVKTTHTVVFNTDGYTSSKTYTYGDKISTQMSNPEKNGYIFAGWNTAADGSGVSYTADSEVKSDLTLYACWTAENYTITYNLNGGEKLNAAAFVSEYNIETSVTLPVSSDLKAREGLTFVGWYKDSAFATVAVTEIPVGTTGNVTLYARWEENTYNVVFDVDGVTTTKSYVHNEKISDHMTEPSKDGFEFTGWNTAQDGSGTSYQNDSKVTSANTLYAQFKAIKYTITYVIGTGHAFKDGYTPVSEFYITSDDIALPLATDIKESATHEFYGWYLDSAYTQAISKIEKGTFENITVYAKWNEKAKVYHDVIFSYNYSGAPQGGEYSKIAVESGNKIASQKPADPSRTGYTFGGWYSDEACTTEFNFNLAITSPVTIYAKWNKQNYSITYDLGGASKGNEDAFVATYDVETLVTLPVEGDFAPRAGYRFNGWYENADFSGSQVTSIPTGTTGNKKFYAEWEKISYTISYETGGAVIENAAAFKTEYTVTDSITLPTLADFEEREAYNFLGWYDNSNFEGSALTSIPVGSTGNKTLWAKWEKKTYNVTFVVDGTETDVTYEHGELLSTKVSDPTKAGYIFDGWNTSSSGVGITYSGNTAIKQPVTLYAIWKAVDYEIDYVFNEGVVKNQSAFVSSYNITSSVTLPVADDFEENAAYEFKGWYTDSQFSGSPVATIPVGSMGNKIFYAKWEKRTYNVTFVVDGTESVVEYTYGDTIGSKMTAPAKDGYTFAGWNVSSDGSGESYTSGTAVTKPVKLYTCWNLVNYTIAYNLNGAGQGNEAAFVTSYNITTAITLPTESDFSGMEAYKFLGWYDNSGFTGEVITAIPAGTTGNKSFWAKWEMKSYDIVFNVDGVTSTVKYNHGETLGSGMTNPEKDGYNFAGWNTQADGLGINYTSSTVIRQSEELYAQWTVIDYTISYNLNGGAAANTSAFVEEYNIEQTVNLPTASDFVIREDYTFLGWYNNSELTGEAVTAIPLGTTGNKTFWAKWEINTYNVNFNIDGVVSTEKYNHGDTIASKINAPEKTGYTFIGWNTNPDGSGDSYHQTSAVKKELTLYAVWSIVDYTIEYHTNGAGQGNTSAFVTSYTIETPVTLPVESDFVGMDAYKFLGWYDNSEFVGDAITSIPAGTTGNKSFWAKWEIKTLTVTFNIDGQATQRTYTYGDVIGSKMTDPSKNGYTFAGWNTSEAGLGFWYTSSSAVKSETTLFAQWNTVGYTIKYNLNGATAQNSSAFVEDYNIETSVTLPVEADFVSREGYKFLGWYDNENFSGEAVTTIPTGVTGNKEYWARWEKNTYTVTFDVDGTVTTKNYIHGEKISDRMTEPSKDGFEFVEWNVKSDGSGTAYQSTDEVKANLTLYAQFKAIKYNITYSRGMIPGTSTPFEFKDGFEPVYEYYVTSDNIVLPTAADFKEYEDYEFYGWYTKAGFGKHPISVIEKGTTGNITVFAEWIEKDKVYYDVVFNYNYNGAPNNGVYAKAAVESGKLVSNQKPLDPERNGYTFEGWYKDAACTQSFSFVEAITAHTSVYAKWSIIDYSITYNKAGATFADETAIANSYNAETEVVLPVESDFVSRPGYEFKGWYDNASFTGSPVTVIPKGSSGNKTFYALWNKITYTVTYDKGVGTVANASAFVSEYTVTDSFTLPVASDFTSVEGYVFAGWYNNAEFTGEAITSVNVGTTGNQKFWAKWVKSEYSVIFSVDGMETTHNYIHGDAISSKVPNPEKTGYTFVNWNTAEDSTGTIYTGETIVKESVKLYAIWKANTYKVEYNAPDATGSTSVYTSTHTYDVSKELIANRYTKEGYTFIGWKLEGSQNTDVDYTDAQTVLNLTATNNAVIKLYATWKANEYTVKYNGNGATDGIMSTSAHVYDVEAQLAKNVYSRSGYSFLGWSENADAQVATYTDEQMVKNLTSVAGGEVTLYAVWSESSYTVKYDGNGATAGSMADSVYKYTESKALATNTFEKTGYTFLGWSADPTAVAPQYTDGQIVSGLTTEGGVVTLYAVWQVKTYKLVFDINGGIAFTESDIPAGFVIEDGKPVVEVTYGSAYPELPAAKHGDNKLFFAGWYVGGSLISQGQTVGELTDTTVIAKWSDKLVHTVVFDSYNSDGSAMYTEVINGEAINVPTEPQRVGYSFDGWYADSSYTTAFDFSSVIDSETVQTITVYIKWNINTYAVNINADNGTTVEVQYVNHGNTVIKPADPEKEGYNFLGWYVGDSLYDFASPVTSEFEIVAKWEVKPAERYSITYVLNGGEKLDESAFVSSYTANDEVVLPTASSFKERNDGNAFAGWYDNENFAGDPITTIPVGSTGEKTFWAKWNQSFVVTFYEGAMEDDGMYINEKKVAAGTTMAQADIDDAMSVILPYDYPESGYKDGEYTHLIYPDLWYVTSEGEWEPFDDTVVVNADMNVFYSFKSLSLYFDLEIGEFKLAQPVSFSVPYGRDTRIMDSVKDAMYMARNQIDIALSVDDIYTKAIEQSADKTRDIIDSNGNIKYIGIETAISSIIKAKEVDGEIEEYIREIIVSNNDDEKLNSAILMVYDSELIKDAVLGGAEYDFATVKAFIDGLSVEEREEFAKEAHNILSQKQYYIDFIGGFEDGHDHFEVSHENINFVMAVAKAVSEYTYEDLKDRIYAKFGKVIDILGDDVAKEFMEDAQTNYYNGSLALWDEFVANQSDESYHSTYPSYLTFRLNAIDHLFKPIYTKYREKVINRLTEDNIYYYADNTYMQQLVDVDADTLISDLFYTVPKTLENTGYALWPSVPGESGFLHYYDYMYEKVLLFDKAMLWYKENLSAEDFEALQTKIYTDAARALNKANEMLEAYEKDGSLPFVNNVSELMKYEAFANVFNKFESKIVKGLNKFKSTQFYGKTWDAESVRNTKFAEEIVTTALGADDPVFNVDSLMDKSEFITATEKAGFTDFEDSFDQDMGYTVTVQAIERIFKNNHVKVRRFHW